MTDTVTVCEVEHPTIGWKFAEFVCVDARLNPDETVEGYAVMHLTNGRRLRITGSGIVDEADKDMGWAPEVNWDELLQLLDAFREARRLSEVN